MELQIGHYALHSTTVVFGILSVIVFVLVQLSWRPSFPKRAPKLVSENLPILGALRFFTARWDFYRHGMSQSKTGNFSFYVGNNPIVGLSGDEGRKLFFESKALGFTEGYAVLFGGSPKIKVTDENNTDISGTTGGFDAYFHKRITRMLRRDNFIKSLPKLVNDTQSTLQPLINAPAKVMDPFDTIYKIVFQLTMRAVACDDIADDPALLKKTLSLYETIDSSATAATILFPRFPTPALIKRTVAGARLYMILQGIAKQRQKNNVRGDDPLQFLLDQGDTMDKIIAFVIGALYAGLLNSGVNAAWTLVYLASNSEWKQKVRDEVDSIIAKYRTNSTEHPGDVFSRLTVEQWESEFPSIDLCLRESIRFQLVGCAFRRNISGQDIPIGDEVIPNGAFVVYALDDIHFNPDVYTDPNKWDPSRYLPERAEDKKKEHAYVGWGTGRHPCLGMKFAKLEQAIIIAHFVALFDFDLSDLQGNTIPSVTPTSRNGPSAKKPPSSMRLKYTVR